MAFLASVVGVVTVPSVVGWLCCPRGTALSPATPQQSPATTRRSQGQDEDSDSGAVSFEGVVTAVNKSSDTLTVKVEVHSSSSGAGSDENMSSSDLSDRGSGIGSGVGGDHDYEDIYLVRSEAQPRSRSRDSGSHSRSASISSTHSGHGHLVVTSQPEPSLPSHTNTLTSQQHYQPQEVKHCDDQYQKGKTKLNHSHSMPHQSPNNRALKRVVSEPGSTLPPPPPPPPPEEQTPPSSPEGSLPPAPVNTLGRPEPLGKSSSDTSTSDISSGEDSSTLRASSGTNSLSKSDAPDGDFAEGAAAVASEAVVEVEAPHAGPNLVNKQMVLPFIPPKFPSSDGDEHSLIKPSEYLRALGNKHQPAANGTVKSATAHTTEQQQQQLPAVHSFQPESVGGGDKTGSVVSVASAVGLGPPPPPLPEGPPVVQAPTQGPRKSDQPLGSISIQDLNSVQLRRTNKLSKTMSAPLSGQVEGPFQVAKQDLIEELKKSKDITGIKKMKVEKVKMEEQQEKELVTEIAKQLSVDVFVEKIPDKDSTGNPIPPWKRQMLAKKAADKARKELEEALAREAEERRLQAIPAWKRQLMQSKRHDDKSPQSLTSPSIEEKKGLPEVQIIENNPTKENKENNKPMPAPVHKDHVPVAQTQTLEKEMEQIIPWRAQLRKTNSTLNLLE